VKQIIRNFTIATVLVFSFFSVAYGAQPGDIISNVADINYTIDGESKKDITNEVNLTIAKTPATIEFLTIDPDGSNETLQPTSYESNSGTKDMPPAVLPDGTVIPVPSKVKVSIANRYTTHDLVLVRVKDIDQNTDIASKQVIDVNITNPRTDDLETLHLTESDNNTGVFVGYFYTKPAPSLTNKSTNKSFRINRLAKQVSKLGGDGAIYVIGGDKISAIYNDNGTNKNVIVEAKAVIADKSFALLTTKTQSKDIASIGDYIQYSVTVENIAQRSYNSVEITDRLPNGVKYVKGSFKVDGTLVTPTLSADGKMLTYIYPTLSNGAKVTINYVAIIGAGVGEKAINSAWAIAPGTTRSNIAKTKLKIKEELYRSKGFILGRVYEPNKQCKDNNNTNSKGCGVEGVKLYMEDGRYVVTDKEGKYHFSDIKNGEHIVQVDTYSIDGRYSVVQCEESIKYAGRARSQFVSVRHGGLYRANFCLKRLKGITGHSLLKMNIFKLDSNKVRVNLKINSDMELIDPQIFLSLTNGLHYVRESATTNSEPKKHDGILIFDIDDKKEVSFILKVTDTSTIEKEIKAVLFYDTKLTKDEHSDEAVVALLTNTKKPTIKKIVQASDEVSIVGKSLPNKRLCHSMSQSK